MLGKLSVSGHPTSLADSRESAYCACSRCEWGLFGHFSLIYLFSFLSPSGRRPDISQILSQRAVKPKTTKQPKSTIYSKGDNFHDFLLAYLEDEVFPKWGLCLKERICSIGSKFFPL